MIWEIIRRTLKWKILTKYLNIDDQIICLLYCHQPTVGDDRLKVNFCVSVPTIKFDTPATGKQLLPGQSRNQSPHLISSIITDNQNHLQQSSWPTCTSRHLICLRTACHSDKSCERSWYSTWRKVPEHFMVLVIGSNNVKSSYWSRACLAVRFISWCTNKKRDLIDWEWSSY